MAGHSSSSARIAGRRGVAPRLLDAGQTSGRSRTRGRPAGIGLWLLAALWFFVLIEPQWLLAAHGIRAALKAPVLLFVAFGGTLVVGLPLIKQWSRHWTPYLPYLLFVGLCLLTVPFAANPLMAWEKTRFYLLMWILIAGTVALVDTARRAELLLLFYSLQFLWWTAWGDQSGAVHWHTTLGNFDGYGSFMVIGAGLCAFMIPATDNKWLRRAMILSVPLCVIGVVTSFARGAALGAVAVFGLIWLRSPRKGAVLAAAILVGGLVFGTATIFHEDGSYWTEMGTIAEGTNEKTGEDRWMMWTAAFKVFETSPVVGVGADNWGVVASQIIKPGELGGRYIYNPGMLYGRETHNSYVQIMAEQGILGLILLGWIIIDFWKRNRALRTPAAEQRWAELGGRLHLRHVAYGLEAAFVGWLCAAFFYSQAGKHWLYSILALNLLLHTLAVRLGAPKSGSRRRPTASWASNGSAATRSVANSRSV